jgi:hypothetical protein
MVRRHVPGGTRKGSAYSVCGLAWRSRRAGACRAAAVSLTALGMAGCGGGSTSVSSATPAVTTGTAQLTINVTSTGAVAESGQLIQPVAATCVAFAEGRDHMFPIPTGSDDATLAGDVFQLTAPIAQYAGPGDYSLSTHGFGGNQLTTQLTVGPVSAPVTFKVLVGSEEAATVNADGSGSFTFLDWTTPGGGSGSVNESGMITWTCQTLSG